MNSIVRFLKQNVCRMCVCFVLVPFFCSSLFASSEEMTWNECINEGVDSANRKDFQKSVLFFTKALNEAKKSGDRNRVARSYDNLAYAYLKLSDHHRAEEFYKLRLKTGKSISTKLKLANLYLIDKKYSKAAELFEQVLQSWKQQKGLTGEECWEYRSAVRNYASLHKEIGNQTRAKQLEDEAIWLESTPAGTWKNPSQYVPRELYYKNARSYLEMLGEQIKRVSEYPHDQSKRIKVAFNLSPSGELGEVTLTQTSGNTVLDNKAVAAVRRAAPFPPLPTDLQNGANFVFSFPPN